MKPLHPLSSSSSPSFALISVLALVSLAALTATAFLASARLERQATMPLTQTTMLEMALNSGCNAAKEMLDYAPSKHFNFVTTYWRGSESNDWTNELGYLLSGAVRSTSIKTSTIVNYYCCFSTATMTNLGTNASSTIVVSNDITNQGTFLSQMTAFMNSQTNFASGQSTNIPLLGDTPTNRCTSPPVGWVYINQDVRVRSGSTNTSNAPVARFAFFVQDLCGMIDAERMGGLTNGTPYRESTALPANYTQGTNPAEISLTKLTGTALTNTSRVSTFTDSTNRIKYLSPGMLVLTNGGGLNTNDLRYVTTGLRHWTNAYERIPVGLGYPNSWSNKYNLSNNANLNVANISAVISNNLTLFTNRAGGMPGGAYVSNIAANIVDLFDSDNFATTVGNSVRGIDSYPFVNEIWDQVVLNNDVKVETSNPTNWVLTYNLTITTWMELWNISSQPVTGGSMSIFYRNRETLTNRTSGANDIPVSFTNTLNYTTNLSWNFTTNFLPTNPNINNLTNSRISPNAFHMVAFPPFTTNVSQNLKIPAGTDPKKTNLVLLWANNGNSNGYATYFSSSSASLPSSMSTHPSRVDSSSSAFNGIQRKTNDPANHFLDSSQTVWWRGNATPNSDLSLGLTGDPRIMFHLNASSGQTWWDHQFEDRRASWWARNTMGAGASSYTVNLNLWPEPGHNSSSYQNTTDPSKDPLSITMPAQETNKPVQIIYNTLPANIVQLGQTFDPMQWSYNVNNNTNGLPLTGAIGANSSGGGHTLRIGRAEHPRFAWTNLTVGSLATPNMMMSSAALLDIFSSAEQFNESGQINLNTAPAPVLRALAGGILLTSDPALINNLSANAPSHPVPPGVTEAFAQGVMRFRAKYPFYSPSQLAFIGTATNWPNTNNWPSNAVFGNTNSIFLVTNSVNLLTSTSLGINEWNDQAAEECFAKIFKLSTTYSRNFRVYVIAQKATNQAGTPIGVGPVVRKYYNVVTRQNTDGAGDVPPASASIFTAFESSY